MAMSEREAPVVISLGESFLTAPGFSLCPEEILDSGGKLRFQTR